jgi:phosphate-selective porin OprO/OprP
MLRRHIMATGAVMAMLVSAGDVFAQTSAQAPAVTAGFQDGFFVQSADGAHRLVFGIVAQVDGRFSLDDPAPITDTLAVRKMRPTLSGRVARYFDFKVMPDFGNGTATLTDAFFDIRFSPKLRVRSGKDKTPVGYEMLVGDAFVLFLERSLATGLVPNRDVGVQVQGDLSPKVYYATGLFNGVPDGASSTSDADTNSGKDFAGRIVVQPFRAAVPQPGALNGLGFQIGVSAGPQAGALPVLRTSVGQTYFAYAPGTTASGTRTRFTPSVFYYHRSFGVFGEFVRSAQETTRLGLESEVANTAWNVTASYLLTGEAASSGITRPARPFDPGAGTWGAVQVLARYAALTVDADVFARGLAAPGASAGAKQLTVGLNWYPASVIKYYLNYERTSFEPGSGPARAAEHVVVFRAQLGI